MMLPVNVDTGADAACNPPQERRTVLRRVLGAGVLLHRHRAHGRRGPYTYD